MEVLTFGKCGDKVNYELFDNGILEISGEGKMWNLYSSEQNFSQYQNVNYVIIHEGVTSVGNLVFKDCKSLKSIVFASTIKRIGVESFSGCSLLETLELPQNLKKIREKAFRYCSSITSIVIPESVKKIRYLAFSECTSLSSVIVLGNNIDFGNDIFYNTAWYNNQPDGCIYINNMLYKYKGEMPPITHIDVKKCTIRICDSAFSDCYNLKSIHLPEGLIMIDKFAFCDCWNLREINIPSTVKFIRCGAFSHCKTLRNISIPSSVVEIGRNALDCNMWNKYLPKGSVYVNDIFYGYKWDYFKEEECLNIKEGITKIRDYSLYSECFKLIIFPSTLKEIGYRAFMYMSNIICLATEPPIIKYLDSDVYSNSVIKVPKWSKEVYMKHKNWGKFKHIEEI